MRVITTKTGALSTLIDVLLHNKNSIDQTYVLIFPYSDHRILLACCSFKKESSISNSFYRRNLSAINTKKIVDELKNTSFDFLSNVYDAEVEYFLFKGIFLKIIQKFAPLKLSKSNDKRKKVPWFDNELLKARRLCDRLFSIYKKTSSLVDKLKLTDQRGIYQTLLRNKKDLFYMDKTPTDFTNSKNFWNFYQALCINQKVIQVM